MNAPDPPPPTPAEPPVQQAIEVQKPDESDDEKAQTMIVPSHKPPPQPASYIKYGSLLFLTFQNALLILSMRWTRVQPGPMYITTTAVVFSETLKLLASLCLVLRQKESLTEFATYLFDSLIVNWKDTLMLSVPAIVYMVQNNLQYVAVSNLDAAVFQVTYQLKILTTALFSVLMLNRKLSVVQWGSLVCLFVGVALVQLQELSTEQSTNIPQVQRPYLGLMAVIVSCLSSGFAGVYVEKMLKQTKVSLWLRNVQLSMFGLLTGIVCVILKDFDAVSKEGPLHGYNWIVWVVISQQALGGLLVAVVVKYADNILKGFSTSLSIILSCIASVFLFHFAITLQFVAGAVAVIAAIYFYGKYPPPKLVHNSAS